MLSGLPCRRVRSAHIFLISELKQVVPRGSYSYFGSQTLSAYNHPFGQVCPIFITTLRKTREFVVMDRIRPSKRTFPKLDRMSRSCVSQTSAARGSRTGLPYLRDGEHAAMRIWKCMVTGTNPKCRRHRAITRAETTAAGTLANSPGYA